MRVSFVTHTVFHYRKEFHERVRILLADIGIDYQVYYGQPDKKEVLKGDTSQLSFGTRIRNLYFYVSEPPLIYQPIPLTILRSDLIIIIQENRLLINYALLLLPRRLRPKLAFFGHGRNFQSRNPFGRSEQFKKWLATKVDWWFGYTDETRQHIYSLGFPDERITVFNNSVDTSEVRRTADAVTQEQLKERRRELGLRGGNVGVYVGGLYEDKRLTFLLEAADRVRERVPDFELVIVGGGPSQAELSRMAATRPWVKLTGPKFGPEKVELMMLGKLFLMPGLVGLALLDAAIAGLPIVTTAFPWHSPEIAYLENGVNGIMVEDWQSVDAFGQAVSDLRLDPSRLDTMSQTARARASEYTIEDMAARFADGVQRALATARSEKGSPGQSRNAL